MRKNYVPFVRDTTDRGPHYGYYPEVKYEYTVNSALLQGNQITADDVATNNRKWAERIAKQYVAGKPVTVYYNPDDPGDALLEAGDSGGALTSLVMGLLFIVVPTGMVLLIGGSDLVPPMLHLW